MNEDINKPDYKVITPFKGWVIENFPFIEADFDAITNYQLISKVTEYLNQVISNENLTEQQIGTLTTAYNNLENYVNNYFNNLDVQEEINNKLDEMVLDGTLAEILRPYFTTIIQPQIDEQNQVIATQTATIQTLNNNVIEIANEQTVLSNRMDEFTSLTEGSTTGDAELADIRVGANGVIYTSAGAAVRANDAISQDILIKDEMMLLEKIPSQNGFPMNTDKWGNVGQEYYVKFIPVNAGDEYYIKINNANNNSYYGFITDLSVPTVTSGADINYVEDTSRIAMGGTSTPSVKEKFGKVPATAHFMFLVMSTPSITFEFNILNINEHDYLNKKFFIDESYISNMAVDYFKQNLSQLWAIGTFEQTIGETSDEVVNNVRRKTPFYMKKTFDQYIESFNGFQYSIVYFNDDLEVESIISYTANINLIQKNKYYRLLVRKSDGSDINTLTNDEINANINIYTKLYYDSMKPNSHSINWIAFGDSITEGYYSYMNGETPTSALDKNKAWIKFVSLYNNWNLTNAGWGGTGYLHVRQAHPADKPAYEQVLDYDLTNYNLITLAYGINDWKGNRPIGSYTDDISETITTVCGAMKKTIENVMNANPKCKIIVVLPFNAWGYSFNYGNKSTNYGLGYAFSNSGTLESFTQKLIEVCNYYGIEYIDETHYSCINRENLPELLIDGVHPSEDCHLLIAQEMASKIHAK